VLWNAYKRITSDYSVAERAALFYGTAARVYRI
jgi:predicted TIM-barrel fold metal-dependent hydrolase